MPITVKRSPHGFYVDQARYAGNGFDDIVEDLTFDRSLIAVYVEYNQKGCECPLTGAVSWKIHDNLGRHLYLAIDRDRKLIGVTDLLDNSDVSEFTLDEDHGFWYFCVGKRIDEQA